MKKALFLWLLFLGYGSYGQITPIKVLGSKVLPADSSFTTSANYGYLYYNSAKLEWWKIENGVKSKAFAVSAGGGGSITSIAFSSPLTGGTITTTGTVGINDAVADGSTKGAATFTTSDFNSSGGLISIDYANGQAASGSNPGFITVGTQTIAGAKTFSGSNAYGTPASITLTNGTGLPISGLTGLGANVGTWLSTPSSSNFALAVTGETGTGAVVFDTTPLLISPRLEATSTSGYVWTASDAFGNGAWGPDATGTGDVVGPGSSINNNIVFFDGVTGKLIKDSGLTLSGSNTGDQTSVTGNAGTATALANPRTIGAATGDVTSAGSSFDGTANNTNAYTLATVNSNVGSFGSATQTGTFTVNGKGLITAASNTTITPAIGSVTGLGTNVSTALQVNVGTAGSFVVNGGVLGTPSSGVATNLTGTASGLTAGNVTTNANLTGVITSVGNATSIASQTGTGTKFVVDNTPTLVTPVLGVASGTSISLTGTGGTGFAELLNQSSAPSTPTSSLRLYSDASNRLSWIGTNGFTRTFDGTANTANRIYVLPDFAGTVALSPAVLTLGSVPVVNSTGQIGEDNANFFYNTTTHRLFLGNNATQTVGSSNPRFQIFGTNLGNATIGVGRFSNDTGATYATWLKSRSTVIGSFGLLQDGDFITQWDFIGDNGVNYGVKAATMLVGIDGTTSATSMPGYIAFLTTATSNTTTTERLRLTPTGAFAIAGATNYGTAGQVIISNGNAAPSYSSTPTLIGTNFSGVPYSALSGTVPFYSLASGGVATGTNTFAMGSNPFIMTTGVTNGTGATAGFQLVGNSATTGNILDISTTSLTSGVGIKLAFNGTAINNTAGANSLAWFETSGANANSSRTAIALSGKATNTGTTSVNIGIFAEGSGATTNYSIYSNKGIGLFQNIITRTGAGASALDTDLLVKRFTDGAAVGGTIELGYGSTGNFLGSRIYTDIQTGGGGDLVFQNGTAQSGTYVTKLTISKLGNPTFTQSAHAAALSNFVLFTAAANTSAGTTETVDFNLNFARVISAGSATIANQRSLRLQSPTFSGASSPVFTRMAGMSIAPPIVGNLSTATTLIGLDIETAVVQTGTGVVTTAYGAFINAPTGATTNYGLGVLGDVRIGGGATASKLILAEPTGSGTNVTTIKAQAQGSDINYTLPATDVTNGFLKSDGSGGLSWSTPVAAITVGASTLTSGTNTRVPFNDSGIYNEDAGLGYDKTNDALNIGPIRISAFGTRNTFVGQLAGNFTITGTDNTTIGYNSGLSITSGVENTYLGSNAGSQSNGIANTAVGSSAWAVGIGSGNIAIGAGTTNGSRLTGDYNILIGYTTGNGLTAGDNNIIIGAKTDAASTTNSNQLSIQNAIFGINNSAINATVSTGFIGIYENTPTSSLHVEGSLRLDYIAKTANYTATGTDYLIDCTANSFTVTLPTAVGITGRIYIIKNSGTATVITLATTSSQTIDGAAPGTLTSAVPIQLMSNGANWITIK